MKNTIFFALLFLSVCHSSFGQTTDSLNDKLVGYWKLESVKFKVPVDINKDGVKSADAMDEYTDCQKDQELELSEDMTAKIYSGTHAKDCKGQELQYKWKVVKRTVRDSRYDNGKRIINDHVVLVLMLKSTSSNDSQQFLIDKVSKKSLNLKAELRDGSDSTSEAEEVYKKAKK